MSEQRTHLHGSHAAAFAWMGDVLGAGLVAAGLALGVGHVSGVAVPPLWMAMLLLLAGGLARAGAQWLAADLGMADAMRLKAAERARHWRALLEAPPAGRLAGAEMARAIDSVEMLEGFEARFRPMRTAAVVAPLLVALLVAFQSPVSAAILVFTLPPFAMGMALAGTAARTAADRQLGAIRHLNGLFLDRLRALPEIRHFQAEERVLRQMADASTEVADRTLATLRVAFLSGGIIEFFAAIAVALVAIYAGFNLLGILPFPVPERLGLVAAFFALAMAPEFYLPMRRLAAAYHDKQMGEAAREALATRAESPPPLPRAEQFAGVSARDLVARHPDGPVIGPVTFAIAATGLTVLVGPTGSGKSTLLAALAGRVPLESGALEWAAGGVPPLGWAGQRPLILSGSLASNLALAAPDAAEAAILATARAAALDELLATRGLQARIDWAGSGLSGGERRRIGVARALLSGRPLLLLDEPTADLDAESAAHVREALRAMAGSRALVVATHDEALAVLADQRVRLS
ncbi:ATP-binding cassette domain-containing protein [Sandaracinobacter sp. RS1-74]|nr:ATP-binding cassette domain-containing protein [Sandaracinobacteroides sayramensis]